MNGKAKVKSAAKKVKGAQSLTDKLAGRRAAAKSSGQGWAAKPC